MGLIEYCVRSFSFCWNFELEFVYRPCDVTSSCFGFSYLVFVIFHVGLVLYFFFFIGIGNDCDLDRVLDIV